MATDFPKLSAHSAAEYRNSVSRIVHHVAESLGARGCSLFLAREPGRLTLEASTGIETVSQKVYYQNGEGLTGWVAQQAKTLRIHDLTEFQDQRFPRLEWKESLHGDTEGNKINLSFLAVPIIIADQCVGVLRAVGADKPFSEKDEAVCVLFSQEIGRQLALRPELLQGISGLDEIYRAPEESLSLIRTFSYEALRRLAREPDDIHRLSSRMFEEFVAELLHRDGWKVELALQTRDGGYDIAAVRSVSGVGVQLLVEAKKHRRDRPVGVSVVRSLYSVKNMRHASKAMLVTSSYLSSDAKEEFHDLAPWEMDWREYDDLVGWLRKHGGLIGD